MENLYAVPDIKFRRFRGHIRLAVRQITLKCSILKYDVLKCKLILTVFLINNYNFRILPSLFICFSLDAPLTEKKLISISYPLQCGSGSVSSTKQRKRFKIKQALFNSTATKITTPYSHTPITQIQLQSKTIQIGGQHKHRAVRPASGKPRTAGGGAREGPAGRSARRWRGTQGSWLRPSSLRGLRGLWVPGRPTLLPSRRSSCRRRCHRLAGNRSKIV